MRIAFLGTGPATGIPKSPQHPTARFTGKSRRMPSSILIDDHLLIDATPFIEKQLNEKNIEAILITHAHRDACMGLKKISKFIKSDYVGAHIPVYALEHTIAMLKKKIGENKCLTYITLSPNKSYKILNHRVKAYPIKHSVIYPQFDPTAAFQIDNMIYCEDVDQQFFLSEEATELKKAMASTSVVILDGAMCEGSIRGHLNIWDVLPELEKYKIKRIYFTQIGHSCPRHEALAKQVESKNKNYKIAYDGLVLKLGKVLVKDSIFLIRPYGELFLEGKITGFIKRTPLALGAYYLCSGQHVHGIIMVNEAKLIQDAEVQQFYPIHRVGTLSKKIWYGDAPVYLHKFVTLKKFK